VLFSIVRVQRLKAFRFSGKELTDHGVGLLNMQMAGILIGGTARITVFPRLDKAYAIAYYGTREVLR
jgi:hypothetical protein